MLLWTVCLLHVLCSGIQYVAAQDLKVSTKFMVDHIAAGRPATADCRLLDFDSSTHTINSITWQHNSVVITSSVEESITNNFDAGTSRLHLSGPLQEDAGIYRCTVKYSFSGRDVTVFDDDTLQIASKLIVEADPIQEALLGETAELRCNASSSIDPTLSWYKVPSTATDTLQLQHPGDSDFGVYRINTVNRSDEGQYRCVGENSFDDEEVIFELIIPSPPVITSTAFTGEVTLYTNLTLPCDSDGRSDQYSWSYDNNMNITETVTQGPQSRFSIDANSGSLTILRMSYGDDGMYTCLVTNLAGTDTMINRVTVTGPPIITRNGDPTLDLIVRVARGSTTFLGCPVIGNPVPTLKWHLGTSEQEIQGSRYRIHNNGTLEITDSSAQDAQIYRCLASNTNGDDELVYNLQVLDIPDAPVDLRVTVHQDDSRQVVLEWATPEEPVESTFVLRLVEYYVVEKSLNGGEYVQLDIVISGANTTVTMFELLPGERHDFRLRAGNVAGISEPSNSVTHTPPATTPKLSQFQATPLSDGRSVLVTWTLEYDGGFSLTQFEIQVHRNNMVVSSFPTDVSTGQFTVTNLIPDSEYAFSVVAANVIGNNTLEDTATTTSARPSQPSSVTVTVQSDSAFISFSVEEGSQPITFFLINITEVGSNAPPIQLTVAIDDQTYITSIEEIVDDSRGGLVGYEVVLTVTDLEKNEDYEFRVAAMSVLGVGLFSEPIDTRKPGQDQIVNFIIAGVVGGMLLVIMVIVVAVVMAMCRRRCNKGRKIAINGHGSPFGGTHADRNTDAFILQSPPPGRRGGSLHRSPPVTPCTDRQGLSSPSYLDENGYVDIASLSTTKLNTQTSTGTSVSGTNMTFEHDTVVDMPDNNLGLKTEFHSSTKSMPYISISGENSLPRSCDNRQHLCLQTSFNSMGGGSQGDDNHLHHDEGRSIASEKHLIVSPTSSNTNTLSKSTPVINRLSCDSVLDTIHTSYMTDV